MAAPSVPLLRPDQIDTTVDVILDARLRPAEARILHSRTCSALRCLSDPAPNLPPHRRIAVYSDSQPIARALVEHLRQCGFAHAAILAGGFEDWRDLGMPLGDVENGQ